VMAKNGFEKRSGKRVFMWCLIRNAADDNVVESIREFLL
jgi:hypothetical protein